MSFIGSEEFLCRLRDLCDSLGPHCLYGRRPFVQRLRQDWLPGGRRRPALRLRLEWDPFPPGWLCPHDRPQLRGSSNDDRGRGEEVQCSSHAPKGGVRSHHEQPQPPSSQANPWVFDSSRFMSYPRIAERLSLLGESYTGAFFVREEIKDCMNPWSIWSFSSKKYIIKIKYLVKSTKHMCTMKKRSGETSLSWGWTFFSAHYPYLWS